MFLTWKLSHPNQFFLDSNQKLFITSRDGSGNRNLLLADGTRDESIISKKQQHNFHLRFQVPFSVPFPLLVEHRFVFPELPKSGGPMI